MSSNVVKKLQKLHIEERSAGLEELASLGPIGLDWCPGTPVRQKQFPNHDLTDSMVLRKEKVKVAENEKYYYRSPCPERENLKNSARSPSRISSSAESTSSLVESVAKFATVEGTVGTKFKVFVGNISYRVKDRELRECFQPFGVVVRANVCKDRKTKKSRGFGFVVFSKREEAEKAINAPDDLLTYDGRLLKVTWAERKKGKTQEKVNPQKAVALEALAKSYLEKEGYNDSLFQESLEEKSVEESLIDKLNEDILLKIFLILDLKERIRVERVCRKWYNIARQSWKSLISLSFKGVFTAFKGTGGLTDKIFISILKRGCSNLQKLDLSRSPYLLTPYSLKHIGSTCPALKYLDLSNVAVNNQNMKEIGQNCREIETLILGRCKDVGEKGLWWFLKEARNLKHLEVTDDVRITGKSFWMLSDACKVLNFNRCVKISDGGLENISKKAPNLVNLNISNCLLVSDLGLSKICSINKELRMLVFSEASAAVTVIGLMAIGQLPNLECLHLSQNQSLDDNVLIHIAQHCKKLKSLNIEACYGSLTDAGVSALSTLQFLEELNISYLTKITNTSLEHLAANSALRSLVCKACTELGNQGLVSLLLFGGRSLVFVEMSGCYAVDDNALNDEQLTERDGDLPRIQINVGGTSMTFEGAKALEQKIKNCEVLYEKRYNTRLRNDFDPTSMAPFYPSDDDDDDDDANNFAEGLDIEHHVHSIREDDIPGQSFGMQHFSMSQEQADDFLEADDPALLDELEEEFLFE